MNFDDKTVKLECKLEIAPPDFLTDPNSNEEFMTFKSPFTLYMAPPASFEE